jgi:mannose-6-phosphate isomerase-like protein (cupin superfamily)
MSGDSMETKPFNIATTYIALNDAGSAWPLPVTPDFWQALMSGRFGEFSRMVACLEHEADWKNWERHPAGEELVLLLKGSVVLVLEQQGVEIQVALNAPGDYVLVPINTWHTAKIKSPSRMLFITPGEGTEHRNA